LRRGSAGGLFAGQPPDIVSGGDGCGVYAALLERLAGRLRVGRAAVALVAQAAGVCMV